MIFGLIMISKLTYLMICFDMLIYDIRYANLYSLRGYLPLCCMNHASDFSLINNDLIEQKANIV